MITKIYKRIRRACRPLKLLYGDFLAKKEAKLLYAFFTRTVGKKRVFYLGRTENNNLGDNGQHYCIMKWIKDNYPDRELYVTPSCHITNRRRKWLTVFTKYFNYDTDIIIFQSGYCTQDLGGDHPLMHELICENLKDAQILMMPQTVFFQHENNKLRTAKNHDQAHNMLFLARDKVSYDMAKNMFPHIRVKLFPDIVTTLIGKYNFNHQRNRIFLCCRNDGEKFYSDIEIEKLRKKLEELAPVDFGDTQSHLTGDKLRKVLEESISAEIERLSQYKVVITDRYHGTIYTLCANTPVIIIKTKDHKVTTGADWFKGIYDNHVFVAKDLDDAFQIAERICSCFDYIQLTPYFEERYYNHLKDLFENNCQTN